MDAQRPEEAAGVEEGAPDVRFSALERALGRAYGLVIGRAEAGLPIQDLPFQQARCLHVLARIDGSAMKDVAARLNTDLPSLSRLADRLERRGLAERRGDSANRRIVRLFLTEKAHQMLADAHRAREEHLRRCAGCIDPVLLEELTRLLTRLADAAREATGEPNGPADDLQRSVRSDEEIEGHAETDE